MAFHGCAGGSDESPKSDAGYPWPLFTRDFPFQLAADFEGSPNEMATS